MHCGMEGVVAQELVKISGRCRPIRQFFNFNCVLYEKPLLESGTMGTGAKVDVIVPHTTNSFSDGGDAEAGGGIPMCTLRNFPHLIDHCIEWARAKFTDLFVSPASQLQQFLENPEGFISGLETKFEQHERIGALERGVDTLKAIKDLAAQVLVLAKVMITCVSLAWRDFHAFFRDVILQLIATFPAGAKTKSGEPFWSGHKIFPEALEFDPQNPLHKEFLIAAANLYACVFKVGWLWGDLCTGPSIQAKRTSSTPSDVAAWFINKRKVYPVKPVVDYSKLPPIDIPVNVPDDEGWWAQVNALIQARRKANSSGKMPEITRQDDTPTSKSIKRLAQEAGLDTKKKKLLVFDDVALTNEDGDGGYSYASLSPDGSLLVAESFVWDMHTLECKQRMPVTATDMVWTKDGKHLIGPSYSRVYIYGLGAHEAERTVIYENPFPGAELACAATSGGVIERWQKEP
ncbi:hypothetical protein PTSG_07516 [Salpingoeca rosetta]|uniref:Ubiquitin-activating enzyme SCCH domain-containing protein n=1 Tax=Salpingoeca rosetta (strain ATCC 50818 / BSB-021) TaxID=946362 RepID=F2UGZ4_SALR5|nr:uncharacterized protein PTSG_07516 [Salpingoeca rosetta]EGD76393.1 hypothetical protein PTSG_07516 [Salpingoeca rosetta]|eukprot:XP_004991308.1 hypothetical protein PTSG_07516 [Salpingoeca rosetta]